MGIHEAKYEITVLNPPKTHLGKTISGALLLQMLQLIRDYYANLLFEARYCIGEGHSPQSAGVNFTEDASMRVKNTDP